MDDTPHDPQHDMARRDAPMHDQPRQTPSPDTSHFTMTVEAASARFADAGLPRSIRSIQRYCQRGHLSCTTVDTEIAEMYVIDPDSVERRIRELQQIEIITQAPAMSRQDASGRDGARHDATVRDASRQASSHDQVEEYGRRIKELEDKAMHLEIDKRAKEQIINMLKEDRENLFAQVSNHVHTITDQARVIGQLETRLELGPGKVAEAETVGVHEHRHPQATIPDLPLAPKPHFDFPQTRQQPAPHDAPEIEYPPRYGDFHQNPQGDNPPAASYRQGVQ